MPSRYPSKFLAALAVALVCALPASAQDEGPTPLQRMLGNFGLIDIPSDESQDYRERAPLVVPPSTELPVPRSPGDIARAVPDWPTDPEVVREAERKRAERSPIDFMRDPFYLGAPARPNELRRGPSRQTGPVATTVPYEQTNPMRDGLLPNELGGTKLNQWLGLEKEKPIAFTGEPPRTRLTEPPAGYLTPSPNAPYGVVEKEKVQPKPASPFDRLTAPK